MAIFNCHVSSPEGKHGRKKAKEMNEISVTCLLGICMEIMIKHDKTANKDALSWKEGVSLAKMWFEPTRWVLPTEMRPRDCSMFESCFASYSTQFRVMCVPNFEPCPHEHYETNMWAWYDMIWCDMTWHDTTWHDMISSKIIILDDKTKKTWYATSEGSLYPTVLWDPWRHEKKNFRKGE